MSRSTAPRPDSPELIDRLANSQITVAALGSELTRLAAWGRELAERLADQRRLLAAGNGGSAALAEHTVGEVVGRFEADRPAFSGVALCSQTVALTAIGNDFGFEESFARQVRAHGRAGDVLLALSTSGRSENLLRASQAGRDLGLLVLAMTGPRPNPLAEIANDALTVPGVSTPAIQDAHQVAVHLLCAAFDSAIDRRNSSA